MSTNLDILSHLTTESTRFAEAIAIAPTTAPVPSCPGWTADDLLWHLGWVQQWWSVIVRDDLTGPEARQRVGERPASRPGLLLFFAQASASLQQVLATAVPSSPAWTWSDDQTVGFIQRKQVHEALIHRVDAELTANSRTPLDPQLSADGVDEVLRVMYSAMPGWATFTPEQGRTLRIRADDTGDSWLLTMGRFTGTDPEDQVSYDEPDFDVARRDSEQPTSALITGSAADLDCWLWHRPPVGSIHKSGNENVLADFEATIAPGID
jgi:uncharacterized protein (TIGR03083 family)